MLNGLAFLLIIACIAIVSIPFDFGDLTFVIQLMLVGLFMLILTIILISYMKKVFDAEFNTEKMTLKVTLFVFLVTYIIRAVMQGLVITMREL